MLNAHLLPLRPAGVSKRSCSCLWASSPVVEAFMCPKLQLLLLGSLYSQKILTLQFVGGCLVLIAVGCLGCFSQVKLVSG